MKFWNSCEWPFRLFQFVKGLPAFEALKTLVLLTQKGAAQTNSEALLLGVKRTHR